MRILLTGGAGFIGSHVADALLAAGHRVTVVDDLSSGRREQVPAGASFHRLDIGSPELGRLFAEEHPEIVNHHAAQISVTVSARDPQRDARVNAVGLLNVLESCRAHAVRKVIFSSSGGAIYGEAEPQPIPETCTPRPLSPYAIHKLAGEHYLRFYEAQYGLAWTTLRYANVYGPRQDPHGEAGVVAIFISKLLAGEVPTVNAYPEDPDGMSRDYVYVQDVARANVLALECGDGEAINIATARAVRTKELLAAISRTMGIPLKFERAGPRPGDLRASCLDNAKARAILAWSPARELSAGLAETVAWFRTHA